jgi:hypothetical protein
MKSFGSTVSTTAAYGAALRPPEWRTEPGLLPYEAAVAAMEERVAAIRAGTASELVWLIEHPPLYTAGTSAIDADLIDTMGFPVYPASGWSMSCSTSRPVAKTCVPMWQIWKTG